jgi:dihydroxy-acid dehydratase
VREGDQILIDVPRRLLQLEVDDEELRRRLSEWKPRPPKVIGGYLRRYSYLVQSADKGGTFLNP